MESIKIVAATEKDSALVLSFVKGLAEYVGQLDSVTATEDEIRSTLFAEGSPVVVKIACWEGIPAGFIVYFRTYSTFSAKFGYYIEDLFVSPEFRGRGVGKTLLDHVIAIGVKERVSKVEWYVNNANADALQFYKKMGARVLDYKSILYVKPGDLGQTEPGDAANRSQPIRSEANRTSAAAGFGRRPLR